MRTYSILSGAMLVLAMASVASAQQSTTVLNLGYRASSSDGDEARWERYRDLRSGPVFNGIYNSESGNAGFKLTVGNPGYHDQQYAADYNKYGKLKFSASWNSIPLNYAYNTFTPWQDAGNNVWTLDPATRTAVQNKTAFGIGTTAADFSKASVYRALATPFSMQSRRDILNLGMKYRVSESVGLSVGFGSTKRGGTMPFGGSFAFNNGNEHPITLDDRTNNISAGVEWAKPSTGMLRLEWNNSQFKNEFISMTWDNPLRATDFTNGKAPPAGPYDPSGYSNGNGPAQGRLALPPSSSMNTFSLVGLRKLPGRTTMNGQLSYTTMKQDEELIPWTTNSNIANSAVYAAFPHLAHLPRTSAEAEIQAVNAMLSFNTRPSRDFAFDVRYRFNDRENKTPVFDAIEYVRFDAVPEETGGETGHYNIRQNTFETSGTFTGVRSTALKVGYIMDDVKREGRAFGNMTDYTLRVSADHFGNQFVTVRGVYENTHRVGSGLNEEHILEGGGQPNLRFYDEAPLTRNKGTLILQLNPAAQFGADLSVAIGQDKYNGEDHEFGLLDNSNSSYNLNLNWNPIAKVALGANFGYDKFSALQESRNANPFSGVAGAYESWNDPNRNWSVDNDETVKTYGLNVDFLKALPNTDLRLAYDRSQSDNAFVFGGPRIQELSTNTALTPGDSKPCGATSTAPCFTPFPNVTNDWQRLRVSLQHMFGAKYGVSLGYSYEKFDIEDFATLDADGKPRIDPLGAITTGYGNRPYTGNLFTLSLRYMFQAAPIF